MEKGQIALWSILNSLVLHYYCIFIKVCPMDIVKKKKKVSNDEIMNAYYVLGTILNILCEIISFDPKKSYEVGSFIITQNKWNKKQPIHSNNF